MQVVDLSAKENTECEGRGKKETQFTEPNRTKRAPSFIDPAPAYVIPRECGSVALQYRVPKRA